MKAAMDRFERLLGKKPNRASAQDSDEPAVQPDAASTPGSETPPDPPVGATEAQFGLKFVFDSGEARVFISLPITIGRGEGNHLVLTDDSVSAQHAVVVFDELLREICLVDLDSVNGVFIDDHPTRKNVLQDGARIGLGQVHLVFRDTGYIHPS